MSQANVFKYKSSHYRQIDQMLSTGLSLVRYYFWKRQIGKSNVYCKLIGL